MAWRVVWSETAAEDLREIVQFIGVDDRAAATGLAERIFARVERAAEFPFSNRAVPEKSEESLREIILQPYRIIYHVDEHRDAICILRVWHAARGVPDLD